MTDPCPVCGSPIVTRNAKTCSRTCGAKRRVGSSNSNYRGGKASHPLYHVYHDAKRRCTNPSHARYADYGGRGIQMCEDWTKDFWQFVLDMGSRPDDNGQRWTIDRIDNDGPYSPENCRWATHSEQMKNRRRHGHEDRERDEITGRFK